MDDALTENATARNLLAEGLDVRGGERILASHRYRNGTQPLATAVSEIAISAL